MLLRDWAVLLHGQRHTFTPSLKRTVVWFSLKYTRGTQDESENLLRKNSSGWPHGSCHDHLRIRRRSLTVKLFVCAIMLMRRQCRCSLVMKRHAFYSIVIYSIPFYSLRLYYIFYSSILCYSITFQTMLFYCCAAGVGHVDRMRMP